MYIKTTCLLYLYIGIPKSDQAVEKILNIISTNRMQKITVVGNYTIAKIFWLKLRLISKINIALRRVLDDRISISNVVRTQQKHYSAAICNIYVNG